MRPVLLRATLTSAILIPAQLCCQVVGASSEATPRPSLVVLITVDQLRPDYLERFGAQLSGGLGRLYRSGAVFTAAFQDHANTETAPGHASLLSGRFPAHTGILLNDLGVPDPNAPLVGGGGPGASPFRFLGSTLVDWMAARWPATRVLSASRKDRGAILPIGRSRRAVFWYAPDGRFTTSTYYGDTLPNWVERFNARRLPWTFVGKSWTLLLPASNYQEPDSVSLESGGQDFVFPHALSPDTARALRDLIAFPWMDDVTLNLAVAGVTAMRLGMGPTPDLLAVSLSSTDAIGHRFGPDSRELHDQIIRLDRALGRFLDSLFTLRDSTRVIVALSADHGVTPYPELAPKNLPERPVRVDLGDIEERIRAALSARGVASNTFTFDNGIAFLDRRALSAAHIDADSLLRAFAASVCAVRGVARADLVADLRRGDTVGNAAVRRWIHALPADVPAGVVVTLKPYSVWAGASAQHGSGNDLDAHVPLIFWGAPFQRGRYSAFVRTVDIAPTLARVLGIPPAETLDGRVLDQAIRLPGRPRGR